jgi:hypothetical protein
VTAFLPTLVLKVPAAYPAAAFARDALASADYRMPVFAEVIAQEDYWALVAHMKWLAEGAARQ